MLCQKFVICDVWCISVCTVMIIMVMYCAREPVMLTLNNRVLLEQKFVNINNYTVYLTERGGFVVTHETRIRKVSGSNPVAG